MAKKRTIKVDESLLLELRDALEEAKRAFNIKSFKDARKMF